MRHTLSLSIRNAGGSSRIVILEPWGREFAGEPTGKRLGRSLALPISVVRTKIVDEIRRAVRAQTGVKLRDRSRTCMCRHPAGCRSPFLRPFRPLLACALGWWSACNPSVRRSSVAERRPATPDLRSGFAASGRRPGLEPWR